MNYHEEVCSDCLTCSNAIAAERYRAVRAEESAAWYYKRARAWKALAKRWQMRAHNWHAHDRAQLAAERQRADEATADVEHVRVQCGREFARAERLEAALREIGHHGCGSDSDIAHRALKCISDMPPEDAVLAPGIASAALEDVAKRVEAIWCVDCVNGTERGECLLTTAARVVRSASAAGRPAMVCRDCGWDYIGVPKCPKCGSVYWRKTAKPAPSAELDRPDGEE